MDLLFAQQNAVAAILEKIAGEPFGAGAKSRVFHQGDTVNLIKLPACAITFAEEVADDLDTRRTVLVAPLLIQVWFDSYYKTSLSTRERHADLLELVKNAMNADRTVKTSVVDSQYTGGGNALLPEDPEAAGDRWTFTCRFESTYRHLTTDSSEAV